MNSSEGESEGTVLIKQENLRKHGSLWGVSNELDS